jgi:hypothetical protein
MYLFSLGKAETVLAIRNTTTWEADVDVTVETKVPQQLSCKIPAAGSVGLPLLFCTTSSSCCRFAIFVCAAFAAHEAITMQKSLTLTRDEIGSVFAVVKVTLTNGRVLAYKCCVDAAGSKDTVVINPVRERESKLSSRLTVFCMCSCISFAPSCTGAAVGERQG